MMNLNKWLCKTFDTDKKGHATIKDVVYGSSWYLSLIVATSTGIYSVYRFMISGAFWNASPVGMMSWEVIGGTITTYAMIAIAFVIISIIRVDIETIWNYKIAKCPLKGNENK